MTFTDVESAWLDYEANVYDNIKRTLTAQQKGYIRGCRRDYKIGKLGSERILKVLRDCSNGTYKVTDIKVTTIERE